jgi:hypothetical protein
VMAAVKVVLPWSTWPMVPTLTCGLVRSNVPFAITLYPSVSSRRRSASIDTAGAFLEPRVDAGLLKSYAACQGAQIARLKNKTDSKQLTSVSKFRWFYRQIAPKNWARLEECSIRRSSWEGFF